MKKAEWKKFLNRLVSLVLIVGMLCDIFPHIQTKGAEIASDEFEIVNGVLVKYSGNEKKVVIPKGVTRIGDSAFEGCSSLSSVSIPKSVTSIGDFAFSGCSSLKSVSIPKSVTSIGGFAFLETRWLKNKKKIIP